MTPKDYKKHGRWIPVTNIHFTNEFGNDDCTQFDTQDDKELAGLWWEFCKENGLIDVEKCRADYLTGMVW